MSILGRDSLSVFQNFIVRSYQDVCAYVLKMKKDKVQIN